MAPMEKYINTARKPTDQISRCLRIGVSLSFRASSASDMLLEAAFWPPAPFSEAP